MVEAKPQPRPSPESAPFWEGAKAHRLLLPRCKACGRFWFPPSRRCVHCLSADFAWAESRGAGRIYSFVVFHRVYHPAFEQDVPYTVAIVELDEGPRLIANIVGTPPDDVRCDMRVRVVFEERGEHTIPQFEVVR
jgi:uncharacterized OB-fold protein